MLKKIVILSDIHLGSSDSNPKEIINFLKENKDADEIILNGDIIDGWKLKRGGRINKKELELIRYILKLSKSIKISYIRGNHDDFLDPFIGMTIGSIKVYSEYSLKLDNKYYLVLHGDVFDKITKELKWIANLGDIGYTFLIKLNKLVNLIRFKLGLPYYSLSKYIKLKVKRAVNYISDFEENLAKLAEKNDADGIICGHIHHPEIRRINRIEYLNSGDVVESMTALVYENHQWEIREVS